MEPPCSQPTSDCQWPPPRRLNHRPWWLQMEREERTQGLQRRAAAGGGDGPGAAAVASLLAAVLTEIYLCDVCSCQNINIETQRPRLGATEPHDRPEPAAALPGHQRQARRPGLQAVPVEHHRWLALDRRGRIDLRRPLRPLPRALRQPRLRHRMPHRHLPVAPHLLLLRLPALGARRRGGESQTGVSLRRRARNPPATVSGSTHGAPISPPDAFDAGGERAVSSWSASSRSRPTSPACLGSAAS
jgi:hypothetical protein